jgi:hypothetical protein
MRFIRTEGEQLKDLVLALVLFEACQPGPDIGDRLKTTKLLFIATHSLFRRQVQGLSLSFYRYTHGPFTREVYEIWEELEWMGYLDAQPGPGGKLSLSQEGRDVAGHLGSLLEGNPGSRPFLDVVRHIGDAWAPLSTAEMLSKVYAMSLAPIGWDREVELRDVPLGKRLTGVLARSESQAIIEVPVEALQMVYRAREMARARPVLPEEFAEEYERSLSVKRYLRRPRMVRSFHSAQDLRDANTGGARP